MIGHEKVTCFKQHWSGLRQRGTTRLSLPGGNRTIQDVQFPCELLWVEK